jgi:DNA-binding NtrC family response regulator
MALHSLSIENLKLKESLFSDSLRYPELFADIITRSSKMMTVFRYLEAIGQSPEPVLITGESGVGKERVARIVHQLSAPQGPWVAVNVAGLDDQIFSDTLFGHVRGAFTDARESRAGMIEQARHGVLFLDEIGDLCQESQVKLLRLLQENEYLPLGSDLPKKAQTRFVFATNQDLTAKMNDGRFRKDLYYRLKTHQVNIPPLRERREDLAPLLEHFLALAAEQLGKRTPTVPDQLLSLLQNYLFPGNVRELRAMVYDAVTRHQHGVLSMASFHEVIDSSRTALSQQGNANPSALTGMQPVFPDVLPTLKEMANLLADEALRRTDGNQTQAARLLGVTRAALGKRLKGRSQT